MEVGQVKEDTGTESDNEGEKGEFSDAFKRAAVKNTVITTDTF